MLKNDYKYPHPFTVLFEGYFCKGHQYEIHTVAIRFLLINYLALLPRLIFNFTYSINGTNLHGAT